VTGCLPASPRYADLGAPFTSHVLCRSFGTELVRKGYDQVLVAELMATLALRSASTACPINAHRQHAIDKLRIDC
jgi:site-specific recombinase XerD